MSATPAVPTEVTDPAPAPRPRRWRRRLRRTLLSIVTVTLAAYLVVWWVSLRIVIDPSWPPPADAVTAARAQAMTEAFVQRDDLEREDVAIPYAPTTASDVRFYLDGPEFFPAVLEDIAAARHSIHMMMFGMTDGNIAETFATALVDKATQGIEVRVILDAYGAKVSGESKPYLDRMTAAGIQIVVNHEFPLDRDGLVGAQSIDWQGDEIGESDHRKAFVIDGRIGWVGGAGLQDHFNGGTFLDTFGRVEGSIVLQMQAVFLTSFAALGGPVKSANGSLGAYFPEPGAGGTIRVTLLQNVPGGFLPGTQASQAIIEHATKRLDIMNPYFTDPGMLDRIVDAAHRGVRVRLVISAKTNNGPADDALKHHYQRLLDAGIEIWEYPVTVHAKVTVADDAMIIGTINYDAWALYRNLEIGILIEDPGVADRGVAELTQPVIARSVPGEVPEGVVERVRNWMWDKLTYFL